MKQTINASAFIDAFHAFKRYDQFGYEALQILFSYLEELEQDTGEELELDVIAICCDYSTDTWQDIAEQYDVDLSDCEDDDARIEAVTSYLQDNTSICGSYSVTDASVTHFVYCNAF